MKNCLRSTALLVLSCTVIALAGCAHDPMRTESTTNPQVPVELLFEQDGCKIYRFNDSGQDHYWAHCPERDSTSTSQPEGRARRDEQIDTTYDKASK